MGSRLYLLTPLFAVATLPVGILTALFVGPLAAAVVFVVGWLLLVPVTAILFGGEMMSGPMSEDFEQRVEAEMEAAITGSATTDEPSEDPVEVLRQRYARGEISDHELERGLEALLETEGIDSEDTEDIEKTIDRLDDIEERDELLTEKG
jgi:uncharacterized membrane protein